VAYLRDYQQRGDPFLGALVGGALKLATGGFAKKALGAVGSLFRRGVRPGGVVPVAGSILKKGAGLAAGGAAFELGARAVRGGGGGGGRTYKRMNVGNVKALRRSMRRVQGFAKLAKQTISFTKSTRMKTRRRK
jgi:hypothetical protein